MVVGTPSGKVLTCLMSVQGLEGSLQLCNQAAVSSYAVCNLSQHNLLQAAVCSESLQALHDIHP